MLRVCLKSLSAAKIPEVVEVIAALNGKGDAETAELLRAAAGEYDFLKVLELPRTCRGEARNAALKASRGSWLCFLDDDTEVPPDYFANLAAEIALGGADVLGGGQTMDEGSVPAFEKAVYFTLSSVLGAGPYRVRFKPFEGRRAAGPEEFVLCNLALRRSALERNSLSFEGHLTSAEENLLLNKLAGLGSAMRLSGGLNLFHRRRSGYGALARQTFRSGMGRVQITSLYPAGFSFFTAFPGLGLAAFVAGLVFFPLYMSAAACAFSVPAAARASGLRTACVVLSLFPVIHFSYAAGCWWGIFGMVRDRFSGAKDHSRCVCGKETALTPGR